MTEEEANVPSPLPPEACPKCGKKRPQAAESCPRCGLVFALWKSEQDAGFAALDSRAAELLQQVKDHWADTAKHEEFLKHCLQSGQLAAAGRFYRDRLDETPGDVVAVEMQAQVLAKATLNLTVHASTPRESIVRSGRFWLVVLTAMALGIAGGLYWHRLR